LYEARKNAVPCRAVPCRAVPCRAVLPFLLAFSLTADAQSVAEAFNNTPASCDTQCAMNTVASVTGAQNGTGSWTLVYSGSTSGRINIPAGSSFVSVDGNVYSTSFTKSIPLNASAESSGCGHYGETSKASCAGQVTSSFVEGCTVTTIGQCGPLTATYQIKEVWVYK